MDNRVTQKKQIGIAQALREAWSLVNGLKWPIFSICLLWGSIAIASLIVEIILEFLLGLDGFLSYIILKIPSMILNWYLMAILIMLGVRQAIGLPAKFNLALADCMRVKEKLFYLSLTIVIPFVMVMALIKGMSLSISTLLFASWPILIVLFIVWMYYVLIIYLFALPLLVTKRYDVRDALLSAWNSTKQNWFSAMASFLIMNIILFLSTIPFGIGLIWTMPMCAALYGVFFREVYGLSAKKVKQDPLS